MRPHYLIPLSLLLFASLSAFAAARAAGVPGGWTTIKEASAPHLTQLANFAVNEYNKESGTNLKLVKVLSGQFQVVAGINYDLVLAAADGSGTANNYEAVVLEKAWQSNRNLIFFAPFLQ